MAKKPDFTAGNRTMFGSSPTATDLGKNDSKEKAEIQISINDLIPFKNHPYKVLDDAKMEDLVESVRQKGIITPVIVRQDKETLKYELISGHRRTYAAKKAGLTAVPAIIKNLSDDDATILMVDSNIQRESILPSERAFSYKMKFDAIKRQGKSIEGFSGRSTESMAGEENVSRNTIERYIHLTLLTKELLDKVDNKVIPFTVAVEISYLDKDAQEWLNSYIDKYGSISLKQAKEIHYNATGKGEIDPEAIDMILNPANANEKRRVTFSNRKLKKYFPPDYTEQEIEAVICGLLDNWKSQHNPD